MTDELNPPKPRRGRPFGSTKAKSKANKSNVVELNAQPKKRGRPAKYGALGKPAAAVGVAMQQIANKQQTNEPIDPLKVPDYEAARARNETAKAGINEIELKVKAGEYIARAAVQSASATALATMAQTMRSIPDNMERKGISVEVCTMVEAIIDDVMAGLAQELEAMSGVCSDE